MRIIEAEKLIDCPRVARSKRRYEVLVEDVSQGSFFCESYGLAVADLPRGARAELRNVTLSQTVILDLLAILVRNGVAPEALREIVEDYIV